MAAMTDYLEGKLGDHVLRNTAYTSPTTVYVALYTTATTDLGGGTEVTNANGYARQSVAFDAAAADGIFDNTADVTFPENTTSDWGTVTHIAITDSGTHGGGNMLIHGALTASKTVNVGDTFKFNAGDLDITFA